VTDVCVMSEWRETWSLLTGLWPQWKPREQESQLFEQRLRGLRQTQLREAIREAAATTARARPILSAIEVLYDRATPRVPTRTPMGDRGPQTVDQLDAEIESMRGELLFVNRDELTAALARTPCAPADPGDVADWPAGLVGFVWAALFSAAGRAATPAGSTQ
jgi:hypothetical protein